MTKIYFLLFCIILTFSCKEKEQNSSEIISKNAIEAVVINTIYTDSISCRALSVTDSLLWFAGSNGKYGAIDIKTNQVFKGRIQADSLFPEFRSIAINSSGVYLLGVANPALLYRVSLDKKNVRLVYKEENEKVFFDSMQFLDNTFGMAMGDPIEDCLNVIYTEDGGATWQKISSENLPKVEEGEAAFAASNTNLILKGNAFFMVSGGKKARCFVSKDKGKSWQVYDTPIVQGESMTGIFTADFYDENIGIIAGGNYENQNDNLANKALTIDGGKTWKLLAENSGFGYASCVQFVPNYGGNEMVCVGGTGVYYSGDTGASWKKMDDTKDLYTLRFVNDTLAYAAGKNKIVALHFSR